MLKSNIMGGFFLNQWSIVSLYEEENQLRNSIEKLSNLTLDLILNTNINELIDLIKKCEDSEITSANIPQYSSFENGTVNLIERLRMSGNFGPTFKELGEQFLGENKKAGAYIKYGENHAKLARQYELVYFIREGGNKVYLTEFGKQIEKLDKETQDDILNKISLKIPIVQYCIKYDIYDNDKLMERLKIYLSSSTALRRTSNIMKIVSKLKYPDWK